MYAIKSANQVKACGMCRLNGFFSLLSWCVTLISFNVHSKRNEPITKCTHTLRLLMRTESKYHRI